MRLCVKVCLIIGLTILLLFCLSFIDQGIDPDSIDDFIQIGKTTLDEALWYDSQALSGGSMQISSYHLIEDGKVLIVEYVYHDGQFIAGQKSYSDDPSFFFTWKSNIDARIHRDKRQ